MSKICPICYDVFEGFGHNPDPVIFDDYEHGEEMRRCCDYCNDTVVIPTRIMRMRMGMNPYLSKDDAAHIAETYKTLAERDQFMEFVNMCIREEYEEACSELANK